MKFLIASMAAHAVVIAVLVAQREKAQRVPERVEGEQRIAIVESDRRGGAGVGGVGGSGAEADRTRARTRARARGSEGDPFAIAGVSVAHGGEGGAGTGVGIRVEQGTEGTGPGPEPVARRLEPLASPPDVGAIRSAVQRRLRYPRAARERGVEGTVMLRLRIRPDGSVGELAVLAAADPLLVEAAKEAVEEAAPFASAAGTIRLPVEFSLEAAP